MAHRQRWVNDDPVIRGGWQVLEDVFFTWKDVHMRTIISLLVQASVSSESATRGNSKRLR